MNKNAIQKFAVWARNELITQVSQRAYQYGITNEGYGEENAVTVGGRALNGDEQRQRSELVALIRAKGYKQVMEEVAYTWFNRFIALRFMEVNNYLPSHIRVFSDSNGAFKPEILNDVLHLELPGLNRDKVAEYIESNNTDALYRYLLLTQCNALNDALPVMFEQMGGYTEMLLPNNILKQDGVLGRMVSDIPEEDWTDQVQIIGWLYQYYNSELKADTFAQLKKNVKITKERIPSATQLFTPDWIVRYMVENSLGRIFVSDQLSEGRGQRTEEERIAKEKEIADKMGWKYYLPEAEQTPEVRAQLNALTTDRLSPTDLKIIDPCMGSGHILVYAFDVLMQIYEANGVSQRDAAQSILENNLYGLDIDDRAAQLAYFAVMMKARQYDRRIFSRGIQPHVYAIVESNGLDSSTVDYFTNNDPKLKKDFGTLTDELRDAKEYGSILNISQVDFTALYARMEEVQADISIFREIVLNSILPLIQVAEVMAQKYDVVVTNPPYMGASGMGGKLSEFVKKNYPDSKSDLFACFIERGDQMVKRNGYNCMVTMQSWMFLSSFEKLREKILRSKTITNLMHMENMVLGIAFGTAVTVFRNGYILDYKGSYNQIKLQDIENSAPKEFPVLGNRFAQVSASNFSKIPGSPVAYWVSEGFYRAFENKKLSELLEPKQGTSTGNNDLFLRMWHEVLIYNIDFCHAFDSTLMLKKWYPATKGGDYRRWYGNNEYIVDWENDGERIKKYSGSAVRNPKANFREALTWTGISSKTLGMRYCPSGFVFLISGKGIVGTSKLLKYVLGVCCSKVTNALLQITSPTMSFEVGYIAGIPIAFDSQSDTKLVEKIVDSNIALSKSDWDSYETSWDFKRNPLVSCQWPGGSGQWAVGRDQLSVGSGQWAGISCQWAVGRS